MSRVGDEAGLSVTFCPSSHCFLFSATGVVDDFRQLRVRFEASALTLAAFAIARVRER